MSTQPFMDAFARWLVRHALAVVAAHILVSAAFGLFAVQLRIENSLESLLPAGDPEVEYYARARALFGSDEIGVVGVRADDLFTPAALAKIARLTEALGRIQGVERVLSLTNAVDPAADVLSPPRLLPRIPPTPAEIDALRARLTATPLYRNNLVAEDLRGAAINVFFRSLTDAQYLDLDIDGKIRSVLEAEQGPEQFFYTGAAHVKQSAVALMRRDLVVFTPVALALVLLVLGLGFGTLRGVVLPVAAVCLALVWTLGAMVLAGKAITLGTSILPPLLLVIGSSYAIHVMAGYGEQVEAGGRREELVVGTLARVSLPLAISALTTAIGFAALMVSRITAVSDLGLFAVVGVATLTVTSLGFLPAALHLLPPPRPVRRTTVAPALADGLTRLARLAYAGRRPILAGATVLAVLALAGARLIRVDSDFLYYFKPNAEVRRAAETINRDIVGSNPFYLVVEGAAPGALRRWEVLKSIKDLQAFLATLPGVTSSISLVDYLELIEAGLAKGAGGDLIVDEHGNLVPAEPAKTFWEDPAALEPLLAMVETSPATFKSTVSEDFRTANVLVRTRLSGSRQVEETLGRIRAYVAERFPAELRVRPTGALVLMTGTTSDIVAGQIQSLALALGVIFLVMALMFLSAKIGFLAILPNVLPIVIFFGAMGWLGILLNMGTSLIAAIALGIAVDSTIHYMARLNLELKGETDQAAAVTRALRTVGVPMVHTALALCLGFSSFALSGFVPIQNFGILAGATLATALGANLVFLPALLATTKIITLWDLLAVKLGEDPAHTIPLLAGLRPAEARIAVLMGELKRFSPGEAIVRRGEQGGEMYVVIRGVSQVWAGTGAERRRIAEHRRGDVFGEMALVRRNERSADVVAAGEVEVLAIDERFLARIQGRYPRIASRVFLNLARILSDRLEHMTDRYVALASR